MSFGEGLARVGISAAAGATGVGLGAKVGQAANLGRKVRSATLPAGHNPIKIGNALAGAADGAVAGATAGATSEVIGAEGKQAIGVGDGASGASVARAGTIGTVIGGAAGAFSGSVTGAAAAGDASSKAANTVSTQATTMAESFNAIDAVAQKISTCRDGEC